MNPFPDDFSQTPNPNSIQRDLLGKILPSNPSEQTLRYLLRKLIYFLSTERMVDARRGKISDNISSTEALKELGLLSD